MIPAIGQPEDIRRVTPLGLRFWDALFGQPVGDGLSITAYLLGESSRRTTAISNRSGIYLLQNLPGLGVVERGSGDTVFWSNVSKMSFVIEVMDGAGRFQPFTFQVDLPFQGIFTNPCLSASSPFEPSDHLGIPLYSALTRSVPSGVAVIYAALWDAQNEQPASWAMLEASLEGQRLARGFADRQGRIALLFPYPTLLDSVFSPPGSPLHGNHPPLVDQSWTIELQAFYTPRAPNPEIPDLCQILGQSPVTLLHTLSPASPFSSAMLYFGHELVLRSESQSIVWIIP